MVVTVEISMYPFREDYRALIQDFVRKLNGYEKLRITTGPTSTVVIGEYARVMEALTELFEWSHREHGQAVFVTKLILDYDPD